MLLFFTQLVKMSVRLVYTLKRKDTMSKNCFNVTEFARNNGVSRQVVYDSLNGNGSRRIRINLALKLGKTPIDLFPYRETDKHKKALDLLEYEEKTAAYNG